MATSRRRRYNARELDAHDRACERLIFFAQKRLEARPVHLAAHDADTLLASLGERRDWDALGDLERSAIRGLPDAR